MRVLRTHLRKKPTIKVVFVVAQSVYVCNCTLVPVFFFFFFFLGVDSPDVVLSEDGSPMGALQT